MVTWSWYVDENYLRCYFTKSWSDSTSKKCHSCCPLRVSIIIWPLVKLWPYHKYCFPPLTWINKDYISFRLFLSPLFIVRQNLQSLINASLFALVSTRCIIPTQLGWVFSLMPHRQLCTAALSLRTDVQHCGNNFGCHPKHKRTEFHFGD